MQSCSSRPAASSSFLSMKHCELCNVRDIEDEFHFTLICPFYNDLRPKFFLKYYFKQPSMYKFIELVNSKNKRTLIQLTSYYKYPLKLRKNTTQSNNWLRVKRITVFSRSHLSNYILLLCYYCLYYFYPWNMIVIFITCIYVSLLRLWAFALKVKIKFLFSSVIPLKVGPF